jgi:hypothetical protein
MLGLLRSLNLASVGLPGFRDLFDDGVAPQSFLPPSLTGDRAEQWRRFAIETCHGGESPSHDRYSDLIRVGLTSKDCADAIHQIDKDVNRTFGSVKGLRVPQQEALESLRRVLIAYAAHNPGIGYTQSMNFIAAVLLLVVDEETAFWCAANAMMRLHSSDRKN